MTEEIKEEEIKELAQILPDAAEVFMLEEAEPRLKADGWEMFINEEDAHFHRHGVLLYPYVSTYRDDFGKCCWVAEPPLWSRKLLSNLNLCASADTPESALSELESLFRQDFESILEGLFGPKQTNKETEE